MDERPSSAASLYVAVLGDIVDSRRLRGTRRAQAQERLLRVLEETNRRFATGLASPFTITLGDEFEGVIHPADAAAILPELIWAMEQRLPEVQVRFGIGCGTIETALNRDPRMMDGPVFHATREALELAARHKLLGGVFCGFGQDADAILNGLARLLHRHRREWTAKQREVATLLREGNRQVNAAAALDISKQAVSKIARVTSWEAYAEGETAWRRALALSCGHGWAETAGKAVR